MEISNYSCNIQFQAAKRLCIYNPTKCVPTCTRKLFNKLVSGSNTKNKCLLCNMYMTYFIIKVSFPEPF